MGTQLAGIIASSYFGNMGGPPSFLTSDTHTWGWYISSNTSEVTRDGSNNVTAWNDHLGNNNLSEYQGTPHWSATGIEFDGVNEFLRNVANGAIYPPITIYIVFQQKNNADGNMIFDGRKGYYGSLVQSNHAAGNLFAYYGSDIPSHDGVAAAMSTFMLATIVFNGVSSEFSINGGVPSTGDDGDLGNQWGGIVLGGNLYDTGYTNIEVKELIIRNIADSTANKASVKSYLQSTYSLW